MTTTDQTTIESVIQTLQGLAASVDQNDYLVAHVEAGVNEAGAFEVSVDVQMRNPDPAAEADDSEDSEDAAAEADDSEDSEDAAAEEEPVDTIAVLMANSKADLAQTARTLGIEAPSKATKAALAELIDGRLS